MRSVIPSSQTDAVSFDLARPLVPASAGNKGARPATRTSYRTTGLALTNVVGLNT